MRRFLWLLVFYLSPALAAGGGGALPDAPINPDDKESLQRGAALFVGYCLGCHSMQYMRYGRLVEDIGVSEKQVKDHFMFIDKSAPAEKRRGLGDGMRSAMSPEESKAWFNQASPPDLTLSARLRGENWLYAYLRGFYKDPSRPGGWNNAVFENVSMPHVLSNLQGVAERGEHGLELVRAGRYTPLEYDLAVADIVNFLYYAGDPGRRTRYQIGYLVLAFLLVLLVFSYFLYREYWRDINP